MSVDRMSSTLLFNGHKAVFTALYFENGEQSKAVTVYAYTAILCLLVPGGQY